MSYYQLKDEDWPEAVPVDDAVLVIVMRRADGGDPSALVPGVLVDTQVMGRTDPRSAAANLADYVLQFAMHLLVEERRN